MKKSFSIIIWTIALAALLIAAYTFYAKNKAQTISPPSQQSSTAQEDTLQSDNSQQNTTAGETSQAQKIMAPDFTLKDLKGNSVKLSDYKGKIVILNFWAVWCKYCKQEMPDLNEVNKELEKDNKAVILAVDVQESSNTVNEYLKSNNINLKVLMDTEGTVAQTYGITGYPTTFVLNRDGSLYTYISGATDKETLLAYIDKAEKGEPVQ